MSDHSSRCFRIAVVAAALGGVAAVAQAAGPKGGIPAPPWPAGDERGMANAIGPATWARCAPFLGNPKAQAYEVSQIGRAHV